jgi:very-short-patch-repair endonuclease
MDGKVATPDQMIAELAARQHGVISIRQLRKAGISDDAVRARTIAGRLHRVHRGVYAVGHRGGSALGRGMAAVLAVGQGGREAGVPLDRWGAALSHRTAACLWELLPHDDGPVDVVVPGNGGRMKRAGIHLHRSSALLSSEVTLRRGIPVTTPARTVADLRAATAAGRPGSLSPPELRKAIRQADVLGLPLAASDRGDRTRSDLEADFLKLCRRHRLPPVEVNVRVGRHLVDFLWREPRLVVETDAYRYHRGRTAFRDDKRRDLDLRRMGYQVVRLSEEQLNEEPELVAEILAAELSLRSAGN